MAEALARALDAPPEQTEGSQKAGLGGLLETATLVKASKHFELSAESKQSVRAEVDEFLDAHARRKERERAESRSVWWLRLPLIAVGLAAMVFAVRSAKQQAEAPAELAMTAPESESMERAIESKKETIADEKRTVASSERDRPSTALLKAQAEALAQANAAGETAVDQTVARITLDRELKTYRSALIASLDERLR